MSIERLQKQEWLETLDLINEHYENTSRDDKEKKGKII